MIPKQRLQTKNFIRIARPTTATVEQICKFKKLRNSIKKLENIPQAQSNEKDEQKNTQKDSLCEDRLVYTIKLNDKVILQVKIDIKPQISKKHVQFPIQTKQNTCDNKNKVIPIKSRSTSIGLCERFQKQGLELQVKLRNEKIEENTLQQNKLLYPPSLQKLTTYNFPSKVLQLQHSSINTLANGKMSQKQEIDGKWEKKQKQKQNQQAIMKKQKINMRLDVIRKTNVGSINKDLKYFIKMKRSIISTV